MNVWRLTAANTIGKEETEPVPEEGKRKIRITKVFVNRSDALLFSGAKKMRYPRIPGRFAVGLIADEGSAHFPKGARVLLHTAFPAPCDGVEKRDFTEDDILLRGFTADGFLRDFIYVTEDELSLLPESVSDEKALLIQHIALADAAVEKLGIHRGEHVAVVGGSMLGVFICRLLIYRQISPILIDSDARRVEFAKSCGIYYTAPEDDKLIDAVGTITGGRLTDNAVCIMTGNMETHCKTAVSVTKPGRSVAFCGQIDRSLPIDLSEILRKRLTVSGVSVGTEHIPAAINLVANGAIDLGVYRRNVRGADQMEALFKELLSRPDVPVDEINILSLV